MTIEKNGIVYRIGVNLTFGVYTILPSWEPLQSTYLIKPNQAISFKINPLFIGEMVLPILL